MVSTLEEVDIEEELKIMKKVLFYLSQMIMMKMKMIMNSLVDNENEDNLEKDDSDSGESKKIMLLFHFL